jgi:hypothetical protein
VRVKRKPGTLLELAIARVGVLRGSRVLAYMIQWDVVRRELGHEPTREEFSDWWQQSERTTYRDQALFKEAFPGEESPARLMAAARAAWDERRGVAGLGAVPVDVVAA